MKNNSWFIKYVSCINLEERLDRYNDSKYVFSEMNRYISFSQRYYHPKRDPEGGEAGCFRSHIHETKAAYEEGVEYALINEDDLEPTINLPHIQEIQSFVEGTYRDKNGNPVKWDIIYLGGLPNIFNRRAYKITDNKYCNVYKGACILAHSYFIHKDYMKKIMDMDYMGIPIDRLHEKATNSFFVYLPLFRQKISTTTIEGHEYSNSGYKHFYVESQQWYATTVNYPINPIIYGVVVGLILWIILCIFVPKMWYIWLCLCVVVAILLAITIGAYYE